MDKICLQCQQRLSFFKAVRGELFCSPDHRELYLQTESALAFDRVASFDNPVAEEPPLVEEAYVPAEMARAPEPASTPAPKPPAEQAPPKVVPISKPRRPMPNWVVPGTAAVVSLLILGVVLFGPSRKSAVQPLSAAERESKTARAITSPPVPEPEPAVQPPAPPVAPPVVVKVASVAPPKPIAPIPAAIKPSQPPAPPAPPPTPVRPAVVAEGKRHTAFVRARQDSWVAVCSDGIEVLGRALANGDSREIEFSQRAVVRTGNAGGTEIMVDGKPIGSIGPAGALRIVELAPPGFHLLSLQPGDNGHDCHS